MSFKKFGWGEQSNTVVQTRKIARQHYEDNLDKFVEFKLKDDKQRLMGFEIARKLFGKDVPLSQQYYQDCVSFGAKHAVQFLQIFEIAEKNDNEEYKPIFAPYFYGTGRKVAGFRSKGAGSYGSSMASAVKTYGSVQEDVQGLPKYSKSVAYDWSGPPWPHEKFTEVGKQYPVKSTARITTWEELVAATCNGYFCTIACEYGFYHQVDSKGFHLRNRWDPWPHMMFFYGVDNEHSDPYAIIGNSWGNQFGQLRDFKTGDELPLGVLRVHADTVVGMMQDECFAYSSYEGFKVRRLNLEDFAQG